MAEDNKTKQNNDRGFEAQGKHKSHKKKKSSKIYTIIIVLLFCVMGYSGYQIISTVIRDKKAKNTYDEIISDFVVVRNSPQRKYRLRRRLLRTPP